MNKREKIKRKSLRQSHPSKSQLLKQVRSHLLKKYESKFQFNMCSEVNSLLQDKKSRALGRFKDFKLFDQRVEILRRYYNSEEIPVRLRNYVIFYNENEDNSFPNYSVLPQKYIMLK